MEKNDPSAYYWLRVAEASSSELGDRSRALVEQLRCTVKTDEIEALERNVAIAVKNNRLLCGFAAAAKSNIGVVGKRIQLIERTKVL